MRLAVLATATAVAIYPVLPALRVDQGAAGAWQKLLKLQTTASVLHTTAHPDDEQGGLLTALSRGQGVRVGLLTLNRGEAGDNAIGPELFDALGLIRTDELARAGQAYGLDAQYFTLAADYGYSKRLDEAMTEWDRELVLKDMVRAIRRFRPLVVVSRWQGGPRDGHGQHQAAGALTPPAVEAAGDPARFPDLVSEEGLRPWRALKLYLGGARENEAWQVRVETGTYDPVLGETYAGLARFGLSLQRSQTSGRNNPVTGPAPLFYTRAGHGQEKERTLFDGLDTSLPGVYRLLGATPPPGATDRLMAVAREARSALDSFSWTDPSRAAPALARGLAAVRRARQAIDDPDVGHILAVKEQQFADAIIASVGLEVTAVAQPAGLSEPSGPFAAFAPPPELDAVTAGQSIDVRVVVASRSAQPVKVTSATLTGPSRMQLPIAGAAGAVAGTSSLSAKVSVTVPADAAATRPYFTRDSIGQTRYTVVGDAGAGVPFGPPAFEVTIRAQIEGIDIEHRVPVMRREAQLPYGHVLRELEVLPAVGLTMTPAVVVVRADRKPHTFDIEVDALGYAQSGAAGEVALKLPDGWVSRPSSRPLALETAGSRARLAFSVTVPATADGQQRLSAIARVGDRTYTTGYQVIRHRDLPLRYLVREAGALVSAMDVRTTRGLRVGYVMGVGDELPAAIAQLGAAVTLLDKDALATGDLARFDTIVTGTRAYAVRDDLREHNRRVLDWVRAGGNMVVLYNTPEFVPEDFAPYDASLPRNAEEVSEQDAAVEILEPGHALFTAPNRITPRDFEGWIEQRGSKFFASWDDRYTPLVSSHDRDQPPQRGGWLTTTYGKGRWTYMAYALHRQVPYGVPGAYRILANLITPPARGRATAAPAPPPGQ